MKRTPEEDLKRTIENLILDEAPPNVLTALNILAQACIWSIDSWAIVNDAANLVRKNHITADGHWR
uniref:Uncharacterized protein n=1 Tax=viral metagenome TaxID=1070528 RepID=A0A6M3L3Q4_9ZZZZ